METVEARKADSENLSGEIREKRFGENMRKFVFGIKLFFASSLFHTAVIKVEKKAQ